MLMKQYQQKGRLLLRHHFQYHERCIRGMEIGAEHAVWHGHTMLPSLRSRPSLSRRLVNRNALVNNTLLNSRQAASRTLNLSRHQA